MELVFRFSALCVVSAVLSLAIRKMNPELALLLGFASALLFLWGGLDVISSIKERVLLWADGMYFPKELFGPLLKCVGISVVTQLACGVAKDAGQASSAAAMELIGNLLCAWCILPLIEQLFSVIRDLL